MKNKRIKLSDLIEAGFIKPPFPIFVRYKGVGFKAKIDQDGFVFLNGKRYTSLSISGGIVRATVSGKPADGLPYRRVNGWTFWKCKDSSGQIKPLNELRKRYASK